MHTTCNSIYSVRAAAVHTRVEIQVCDLQHTCEGYYHKKTVVGRRSSNPVPVEVGRGSLKDEMCFVNLATLCH